MLRIAYDVVKPILSFHVCTEAENIFRRPGYWHQLLTSLPRIVRQLFAEVAQVADYRY